MNRLFIIEDHAMMRRGLTDFFTGTGRWEIAGAVGLLDEAEKALTDMDETSRPDAILLDLELKKAEGEYESGLDLLPWLRNNPLLKKVPVVVFSNFDDSLHSKAAMRLGANGFVSKSASDETLEALLEQVIATPDQGKAKVEQPQNISVLELLSRRESQIFQLVRTGHTSRKIAQMLGISTRTVENHLACINAKTGLHRRDIAKL
jgi:DNA-binding NarL/FixJ family response regulator